MSLQHLLVLVMEVSAVQTNTCTNNSGEAMWLPLRLQRAHCNSYRSYDSASIVAHLSNRCRISSFCCSHSSPVVTPACTPSITIQIITVLKGATSRHYKRCLSVIAKTLLRICSLFCCLYCTSRCIEQNAHSS